MFPRGSFSNNLWAARRETAEVVSFTSFQGFEVGSLIYFKFLG